MKRILETIIVVVLSTHAVVAQNDAIVPGDNLVLDGVPQIPSSLAETVSRYTEFRTASITSWHPTKREMLINTRFSETMQVHCVDHPGGARTQLTFLQDRVTGGFYKPKKADYFIFSKDSGGNEAVQLYRYDLSTGDITLLTDGKSRNYNPTWSHSGDQLAYGSTKRNGKDLDLYTINPKEPQSNRLLAQFDGGYTVPVDWSSDDSKIICYQYGSADESRLYVVDVASGHKTLLTTQEGLEKVAYGFGEFGKDDKGIYLTTNRDSEFQRLAYVDLATKQYKFLTSHINWDVEEFDLSPDGRTLAFVTDEDGVSRLRLLEVTTGKETLIPEMPPGVISGLKWHKNGRDLGFSLESARHPADVFSLDARTGKIERWTRSETGGLNTAGFPEAELVRWRSFDGRMISGFFYRPPAKFKGPRPVMVDIHGGPESQARPRFGGRNNYILNELGVAIIYPNIRGSAGYGKSYLALDNGERRTDAVKDVGALLDWIKGQATLDADRILVHGGSYGGYITLAVAATYGDRIRAAVPYVAPSNLVTFLENTNSMIRDTRRAEFGDERDPKMREFLNKTAPLNNVEKIRKPLLVIQGKNDPRVPFAESERLVTAAKRQGLPVWFLVAKDEGHGFLKKRNRDFQFYSTVHFINEYLLK